MPLRGFGGKVIDIKWFRGKRAALLAAALLPVFFIAVPAFSKDRRDTGDGLSQSYYYFTGAKIKKRSGDIPAAIDLYKKAAALDPSSALLQTDLGVLYMQSGNFKEARKSLEKAVSIDPKYPEPHVTLDRKSVV